MKIIKQGKAPRYTEVFSCKICGCVFEAEQEEYEFITSHNGLYKTTHCPCCGYITGKEIESVLMKNGKRTK